MQQLFHYLCHCLWLFTFLRLSVVLPLLCLLASMQAIPMTVFKPHHKLQHRVSPLLHTLDCLASSLSNPLHNALFNLRLVRPDSLT